MTKNEKLVEHSIEVHAPAQAVYELIAEVKHWPRVFPPTVHADVLERKGKTERIRLWATANDEVKTWTSRRILDPDASSVEFHQEISQPPVAAMGGVWRIEPKAASTSLVTLEHHYAAVNDDPENLAWIDRAVDRNSTAELNALRTAAELGGSGDELLFSFADTVAFSGDPAAAYAFVYEGDRWKERLPHVARVALTEDTPNVQVLEMDTTTSDGSVHTTRSVRVCFPDTSIVYKQLLVPELMTVHLGQWTFEQTGTGGQMTSQHTVVLKPVAIPKVLGERATVADARDFVHRALSTNSTTTMKLAAAFATESTVRRGV